MLASAIAGVLSVVYGVASALAGIGMARGRGKIPVRAAGLFGVGGGVLAAGGAMLIADVGNGASIVIFGLALLLILAVYNGIQLHGRVNPVHLGVRAFLSIGIALLALGNWGGS